MQFLWKNETTGEGIIYVAELDSYYFLGKNIMYKV